LDRTDLDIRALGSREESMSKIRISSQLVREKLFGSEPMQIHWAEINSHGHLVLDVTGPNIPDVPEIICTVTTKSFEFKAI